MKIRSLRAQKGSYGSIPRNTVVDVPEARAKALLKSGNWVSVELEGKMEKASANKKEAEVANKADAHPSQSGGQRGKAKRSPSSPEG